MVGIPSVIVVQVTDTVAILPSPDMEREEREGEDEGEREEVIGRERGSQLISVPFCVRTLTSFLPDSHVDRRPREPERERERSGFVRLSPCSKQCPSNTHSSSTSLSLFLSSPFSLLN